MIVGSDAVIVARFQPLRPGTDKCLQYEMVDLPLVYLAFLSDNDLTSPTNHAGTEHLPGIPKSRRVPAIVLQPRPDRTVVADAISRESDDISEDRLGHFSFSVDATSGMGV